MFNAGGSPAAGIFLLLAQKKGTKENGTPFRRPCGFPCVARPAGRLRNSAHGLRQSSPTSPGSAALLGGGKGELQKAKFKTELLVRAKPGQAKTNTRNARDSRFFEIPPSAPLRLSRAGGRGRRAPFELRSSLWVVQAVRASCAAPV